MLSHKTLDTNHSISYSNIEQPTGKRLVKLFPKLTFIVKCLLIANACIAYVFAVYEIVMVNKSSLFAHILQNHGQKYHRFSFYIGGYLIVFISSITYKLS